MFTNHCKKKRKKKKKDLFYAANILFTKNLKHFQAEDWGNIFHHFIWDLKISLHRTPCSFFLLDTDKTLKAMWSNNSLKCPHIFGEDTEWHPVSHPKWSANTSLQNNHCGHDVGHYMSSDRMFFAGQYSAVLHGHAAEDTVFREDGYLMKVLLAACKKRPLKSTRQNHIRDAQYMCVWKPQMNCMIWDSSLVN